jgi:hypothetical protein
MDFLQQILLILLLVGISAFFGGRDFGGGIAQVRLAVLAEDGNEGLPGC